MPNNDAPDPINPHYYKDLDPEPLAVIEAWGLGFHLGNVVKYVARSGKKGPILEDLKKAQMYLDRYIRLLEKRKG